jgi:death-on-curing protein
MESLAKNHAFIDGNKRISFVLADIMLESTGYSLNVDPFANHKCMTDALEKKEFNFSRICEWLRSIAKPL